MLLHLLLLCLEHEHLLDLLLSELLAVFIEILLILFDLLLATLNFDFRLLLAIDHMICAFVDIFDDHLFTFYVVDVLLLIFLEVDHSGVGLDDLLEFFFGERELVRVLFVFLLEVLDQHLLLSVVQLV